MNNKFISIGGKVFEPISRQYSELDIQSNAQRTLNGTRNIDYVTSKGKWSFSFELDERNLARLKTIKNLHASFTLIDYTTTSYTVHWVSEWNPVFIGVDEFNSEWHSIQVELEQE
jgi:hypothetical protein